MTTELEKIVGRLEALEDTIIFMLLTRAQHKQNPQAYKRSQDKESRFEVRLRRLEEVDALEGRYLVPEERPFTRNLPPPEQAGRPYGTVPIQDPNVVDLTAEIQQAYFSFLPMICAEGDDGHYGSCAEHDIAALRAIAERVHFGAVYVAECKFQEDPEGYRKHIDARDEEGLMEKVLRPEVEAQILKRVEWKVQQFQNGANPAVRHIVDPRVIVEFYREFIIPLTKKGQVRYLLNRND